jgi:ParB family chromosome partitioning protein
VAVDLARVQQKRAAAEAAVADQAHPATARATPQQAGAARAALSQFIEDPSNPRTEFDTPGFRELVEDIRQFGILQPIVVTRTLDGKLQVRWGARRLRAAQRLGLDTIPYVLQDDPRQASDFAQISENEQREALSPMDLARFVERMHAKGLQKQEIAQGLRKDNAYVTHLLSLASAPGFILDLYSRGVCRSAGLLYHLRILWDKDPTQVGRRCKDQSSISQAFVRALQGAIEGAVGAKAPKAPKAKRPKSRSPAPARERSETTTAETATRRLHHRDMWMTVASARVVLQAEDGTHVELLGDEAAQLMIGQATRSSGTP